MQINKWDIASNSSIKWFILFFIAVFMAIIACLLFAFRDSISFYRTPMQVKPQDYKSGAVFRIGGYVSGPLKLITTNCMSFTISDKKAKVPVCYCGFVPNLFRIGQGVVVEGKFTSDKIFRARRLLTKHDERYHPPIKG